MYTNQIQFILIDVPTKDTVHWPYTSILMPDKIPTYIYYTSWVTTPDTNWTENNDKTCVMSVVPKPP